MSCRIYKPAKGAMSSGLGRTRGWVLEFDQTSAREIEPLMGWTSSADTRQQVRLRFDTQEEAVAYAEREGIAYRVEAAHRTEPRPMSYADNFKFGRASPWTH